MCECSVMPEASHHSKGTLADTAVGSLSILLPVVLAGRLRRKIKLLLLDPRQEVGGACD